MDMGYYDVGYLSPFGRGQRDYDSGKLLSDNPYQGPKADEADYDDWREGWRSGQRLAEDFEEGR